MDADPLVDSCWGPTEGFVWAWHLFSTELNRQTVPLNIVWNVLSFLPPNHLVKLDTI